ncbi:PRP21 [Candida oxycetoniae]|uniref:PRP21 n=1 Tax=Candida oxycetoniae TaxID=497107 RepID=A0AAI9X042_9ASCO|nr:PRP21 [Candida oxycetoniae]KAI3406714.2 PRP21 [Candida oxycetoniae]
MSQSETPPPSSSQAPPSDIKLPGPETKETIDKSITYIVKNGKSFEERLLKNNRKKQFDFLKPENEYHPYYLWKLKALEAVEKAEGNLGKPVEEETADLKDIHIAKPRDLPFFIENFPVITQYDLDVIKTSALYISINGQDQIPKLLDHEKKLGNEAQFEFLKPHHSLHGLFQIYVEQYRLINNMSTNPEHPLRKELEQEVDDVKNDRGNGQFNILTRCFQRAQYIKQNKIKQKLKTDEVKQKQLRFAQIDWQDFVLVDMIEFDAIDEVKELNLPLKRDDLIKRSLVNKKQEIPLQKAKPVKNENLKEKSKEIEETKSESSGMTSSTETTPVPVPPPLKGMKIKAAGTSRLKKTTNPSTTTSIISPTSSTITAAASEKTIICPITNKAIPESQFDTHLKNLLRDPTYKQQQENYLKKNFSYDSNVTTDQVFENIKRLMKKRKIKVGETTEKKEEDENNKKPTL